MAEQRYKGELLKTVARRGTGPVRKKHAAGTGPRSQPKEIRQGSTEGPHGYQYDIHRFGHSPSS